jgi:threonyl-tRNA synthetase
VPEGECPYLLIVGEKEKESRTLAIRSREGEDLGNMSLAQVIELLSEGIARLGRNVAKTE